MEMDVKKKRQRGANFTKNEENAAFSIIHKYKNIVENKKTDAVSTEDKKKLGRRLPTNLMPWHQTVVKGRWKV